MGQNLILNIDKPEGLTSFQVIRKLRKHLNIKKMGHLGTLDPFASGVLPIFSGKFTKLISYFNLTDKKYIAQAKLGFSSDTLDRDGVIKPAENDGSSILKEQLLATFGKFTGEIKQQPPMFSAKKVDGKPLYSYAREGVELERKTVAVEIIELSLISYEYPFFEFLVHCSKGTYVRSLAQDIAKELGSDCYLQNLRRVSCGLDFKIEDSFELDQVLKNEELPANILGQDYRKFFRSYNQVRINRSDEDALGFGKHIYVPAKSVLSENSENSQTIVLNDRNQIVAVGALEDSEEHFLRFQPKKVLI